MLETIKSFLPTKLSKWLLPGSIPIALAFSSFPSYLPSELWAIESLNLLQARMLLAGIILVICLAVSLVSIIFHHRNLVIELEEIKKHMSIEKAISFRERLREIQKKSYR